MSQTRELRTCPDCGVAPGQFHRDGCDVERCAYCGGQRLSCSCEYVDTPVDQRLLPWEGFWPGTDEVAKYGLSSLNDIPRLLVWDRNQGHWVRPEEQTPQPKLHHLKFDMMTGEPCE